MLQGRLGDNLVALCGGVSGLGGSCWAQCSHWGAGGTPRPVMTYSSRAVSSLSRYFLPGFSQALLVQSTPDPHGSLLGCRDYYCPILRRSRRRGVRKVPL